MTTTVQQIIDLFLSNVAPRPNTVDTLKSGRPDKEVRKVAVTFTSTYSVIKQAVDNGADLLVTHESSYYNHRDETEWLRGNSVYEKKRELIESSGIAIFRLHDHIHDYEPDGILAGMLKALDWENRVIAGEHRMIELPDDKAHTVRSIAAYAKEKLGIERVLATGDPEQPVRRIALLPGAVGALRQIKYLSRPDVDLLIAGETNEWEANEYARDAADMGQSKALIVLGHQKSEEAGMLTVVDMLHRSFPELEAAFVESPVAVRSL
ncbi:Nif3-like dinuclear metal center hexameric protein [Cohnella suwonensis]|uniref:GTP cyclohydrolase 1 type 2 homolog n=1 Tax=Cohnella suwonensis TaxID=696072 RepID=A0ABW0M2G8_9BACL